MKVDDNWRDVHILAEDLDQLLGIPAKTSEKFLEILSELIIHRFLEEVLAQDKDTYQVILPYLGNLIINVEDKFPKIDFMVRPSFYKAIKEAYKDKKSPLVNDCVKRLSSELIKRYNEGDDLNG